MPQLHQCLSGTGASSRFWLPHWTLKHTQLSLCLATVVLNAGKSLHLMGRTSREVTRSATLSCWKPKRFCSFFCFPLAIYVKCYQFQMELLERTLSVSVFPSSYHIRLISCHHILVPCVLLPSHTQKGKGLYWCLISKPLILISHKI